MKECCSGRSRSMANASARITRHRASSYRSTSARFRSYDVLHYNSQVGARAPIRRRSGMFNGGLLWRAACGCLLPMVFVFSANALQLISEQEASLPDDHTQTRGISRGPKVLLI